MTFWMRTRSFAPWSGDVVFHLAAQISLAPGADPEMERVNLDGTRNVLAAVGMAGVRRLVYTSSIYALRI